MNPKSNIPVIRLEQVIAVLPLSLSDALEAIGDNMLGIVFLVDEERKLVGTLTDGDARRAILQGIKLDDLITVQSSCFNHNPKWLNYDCDISDIWKILNQNIRCIPLLNPDHKVVDFSTRYRVRRISILEPSIGEQEISNVMDCLSTGWISSQGKYIVDFEGKFTEYLGGGNAIAVSNGTVALQLALATFDIGVGDEVLVPDFTFGASINAIINSGATPVLVDIDRETWTVDVEQILKKITPRTKALMPVHIYGQPARMDAIREIATDRKLVVIEDCAEALGSTYKNKLIGSESCCGCFSFFANKVITTGEGGMVVFDSLENSKRARILRDHGMNPAKRYWHEEAGFNFRMTNMQAAIGVAQLGRITEFTNKRKELFNKYDELLDGYKNITLLPTNSWSTNSYWLYTILLNTFDEKKRDLLIRKLNNRGIDARPGFHSLHKMNPYKQYATGKYPVSRYVSERTICLPSSPVIKSEEISHIVEIFLYEMSNI